MFLVAYNMSVWEFALGKYRKKAWLSTFRVLSDVADITSEDGYSDLVMTAGSPKSVLNKALKRPTVPWYPLSQRLGFREPVEPPRIYIDGDDTIERLKDMLEERPDREEVDCAILVDDDGRLCVEHGTRYLNGDLDRFEQVRGSGFIEQGAGRIAVGAISLEPGVAGYMLKKTGILKEYRLGWHDMEYNPKTGIIAVYRRMKVPKPDGETGRMKNVKVALIKRRERKFIPLNPDESLGKKRDMKESEVKLLCTG